MIRAIRDSKISWISDPFALSRFNNETIYEIPVYLVNHFVQLVGKDRQKAREPLQMK